MAPSPLARPSSADEARGLWFGLLGVVIFAMTLPMTRLAVGPATRSAAVAAVRRRRPRPRWPACCSVVYLLLDAGAAAARAATRRRSRSARPAPWSAFRSFSALALREVDAMHAAVITGVLPLGTAVVARARVPPAAVDRLLGLRADSAARWCSAFAALARRRRGCSAADGLLLLAVLSASIGYVAGARLSAEMPRRAGDLLGARAEPAADACR